MKVLVGTRGSRLSLVQTEEALELLRKEHLNLEIRTVVFKTLGDQDVKTPLYLMPRKGIFEREVDAALLREEVDFAVHSMKDCPTDLHDDFVIAAVPPRQSPCDAFISRDGMKLSRMPAGSSVGTSSPRRMAFLRYLNPRLQVVSLRGNVDTRIDKMKRGELDALVLAEAGLKRLGLHIQYERLDRRRMTPSAGQGALAIVSRRGDGEMIKLLSCIDDPSSRFEAEAERRVLHMLGAGCRTPLAVNVQYTQRGTRGVVAIVSPDHTRRVAVSTRLPSSNPTIAAEYLVEAFQRAGGVTVLREWKEL